MLRPLAACALALCLGAAPALAQPTTRRDTSSGPSLPRDVAREVVDFYNASSTTRSRGALTLRAGETIAGDVAVLGAAANVAGTITGRLLVINGDATFEPGARVHGDVVVVGGVVDGRGQASIGGDLSIYRQILYFRRDGEHIVADASDDEGRMRWWPFPRSRAARSYAVFTLSSGHTYNRVEGLALHVGPSLTQRIGSTQTRLEALLIARTAGGFQNDSGWLGHLLRATTQLGRDKGLRFGGRLYNQVAPVEEWQLGDAEVGLASFFLHRDFRDYYAQHGATAYVELFTERGASLSASYGDERWTTLAARDPWTLFRNTATWRANPRLDDARMHLANVRLHVDTRNDESTPWAGWYLDANYEHGSGTVSSFGAVSADVSPILSPMPLPGARDVTPGRRAYNRGFLDARRYNRLSPEAQFNLRLAAGGWLSGDALPLERRFSVTGAGALPGFDFRRPTALSTDRGGCTVLGLQPTGSPAQCERFLLTQSELRGALHLRPPFGDHWQRVAMHTAVNWVLFADGGRGWLVGEPYRDLVYAAGDLPRLNTFLADVGGGIDFGSGGVADVASFGVYVAKSVTRPSQGANVFVRVQRRF